MNLKMRAPSRAVAELALVDCPIAFGVESHLQQAVLGIVPLAAAGTDEIAAPRRALMIVVLCHGEGCSTAAGNEKHAQRRAGFRVLLGLASRLHDSSFMTLQPWQTIFSYADSTARFFCAAAATLE